MSLYDLDSSHYQAEEETRMYYVEQTKEVATMRWETEIIGEFEEMGEAIRYAKRYEHTRVTYYDHGWHEAFNYDEWLDKRQEKIKEVI